jgi:hypothetical protein
LSYLEELRIHVQQLAIKEPPRAIGSSLERLAEIKAEEAATLARVRRDGRVQISALALVAWIAWLALS